MLLPNSAIIEATILHVFGCPASELPLLFGGEFLISKVLERKKWNLPLPNLKRSSLPLRARIRTHDTPFWTLILNKVIWIKTGNGGFRSAGKATTCGFQRQWHKGRCSLQCPHYRPEFGHSPGFQNFFFFILSSNPMSQVLPISFSVLFLGTCLQYISE